MLVSILPQHRADTADASKVTRGLLIPPLLQLAGTAYLDTKTKFLDEASQPRRKEAIRGRVVEVTELAVRSTLQTCVDELKAKNADGKLTKDEAKEVDPR